MKLEEFFQRGIKVQRAVDKIIEMKRCDNCRREVDNLTPYFELLLCDACYAEQKNNDRINARSKE